MDLDINFDFFPDFLNLYSNPYSKFFFFSILNNLIRNLQEIRKILKLKLKTQIHKKFKAQTQT